MTLSAASVCSKVNEQITNFFISAALEIAYFPHSFLNFFKSEWSRIFFGRAPSRSQMDFVFYTFSTFWMRSWRNVLHQLYQSRKSSAE